MLRVEVCGDDFACDNNFGTCADQRGRARREPTSHPRVGRPRNAGIDDVVLDETLRQLARDGFAGLSWASVAAAAGTSWPAIYRRWPNKEALVVDAVAHLASVDPPHVTEEPFTDLVVELEHFRHCITMAASLPVAGLMLGDGVDPMVRDC